MMTKGKDKSIMQCFGEFVGHIIHAVKPEKNIHEVNRQVEERVEENLTFRRTTIDEIEVRTEEDDQ